MATTAEAFQTALGHHQAGQLREAEAIYRQILDVEPGHADSLHLLGVIAHQSNRPDVAVDYIRRAIGLRGGQPVYYSNLGEAYRSHGNLTLAAECFRAALRIDEGFSQAHNNLGNVLKAMGQTSEAAAAYRRAIQLRPDYAEPHNNLAALLQEQGDLAGAVAHYRRAIAINPRYAGAYKNLGVTFQKQQDLSDALECYREAVRLEPHDSDNHFNLGTIHHAQGRYEQALASFREALRWNPQNALAQNGLGSLLKEQGQVDEALKCYRGALRLSPYLPDALINYGSLLQELGRLAEAMDCFQRAVQSSPDSAAAHFHRGNLYRVKRMVHEAQLDYREALRLRPDFPQVYNNLALLLLDMQQVDQALECCQKGIELAPGSATLHDNAAYALQAQGRAEEAIAWYRKSLELQQRRALRSSAHSNLLYAMNFVDGIEQSSLFAEHLEWAREHAEPLTALARPHTNDRTPDRRLRVGYVSPHFRTHAVNCFVEPILMAHDHGKFEIFCYSSVQMPDTVTARLKAGVDHWRDVSYESDEHVAQLVRADKIDILVDLTGHIGDHRLLIFARKPAPIQVTYIGYQNTTGMTAMDYRLTDERADPPGITDRFYSERLLRLPSSFFCYRPPDEAPPVAPLPALSAGHMTFGSLNNFAKVSPRAIDTWFEILARVPQSRLLVLAYQGGYLERHLHALARQHGIDLDRIELSGKRPIGEYLKLFERVDVALDPFPFNGHTTTCDSIWMGVPVVMLAGNTYASRFGGSVLANVGLERLITSSVEQYIDVAASLAGDLNSLAALRAELRPIMAGSPLLDFRGFTRNLEQAYCQMWISWCKSNNLKG